MPSQSGWDRPAHYSHPTGVGGQPPPLPTPFTHTHATHATTQASTAIRTYHIIESRLTDSIFRAPGFPLRMRPAPMNHRPTITPASVRILPAVSPALEDMGAVIAGKGK